VRESRGVTRSRRCSCLPENCFETGRVVHHEVEEAPLVEASSASEVEPSLAEEASPDEAPVAPEETSPVEASSEVSEPLEVVAGKPAVSEPDPDPLDPSSTLVSEPTVGSTPESESSRLDAGAKSRLVMSSGSGGRSKSSPVSRASACSIQIPEFRSSLMQPRSMT